MPYVNVRYEPKVYNCKNEETGEIIIFLDFYEDQLSGQKLQFISNKKLQLRFAMTIEQAKKLGRRLDVAAKTAE